MVVKNYFSGSFLVSVLRTLEIQNHLTYLMVLLFATQESILVKDLKIIFALRRILETISQWTKWYFNISKNGQKILEFEQLERNILKLEYETKYPM